MSTLTNTSNVPQYALNNNEFFDGIFTAIDGDASYLDLILTGGLDYTVSKQPVMYQHPGGQDPKISEKWSVPMWTDNLSGETGFIDVTVGRDSYTILQNHGLVEAAAEVGQAGAGLINWQGMTVYQNRARIALWGTIGDEFTVAGDPHQRIAVMRWSHDAGWAAGFKAFVGRIWCGNIIPGMILSTGNRSDVSIKHTKSGEVRVQTMADAIAAATVSVEAYEKIFLKLYDRKVSPTDLEGYLTTLFPLSKAIEQAPEHLLSAGEKRSRTMVLNKRAAVRDVFLHSSTQENLAWTAAGLFQAAVEASDHRSNGERGKRMIEGTDTKIKAEALNLALSL